MELTDWVVKHMETSWLVVVLMGAFSHWLVAWMSDKSVGTFRQYWLQLGPDASLRTVGALVTAILAGLAAGVSLPAGAPPTYAWTILAGAWGIGFAFDNVFNRSPDAIVNVAPTAAAK